MSAKFTYSSRLGGGSRGLVPEGRPTGTWISSMRTAGTHSTPKERMVGTVPSHLFSRSRYTKGARAMTSASVTGGRLLIPQE